MFFKSVSCEAYIHMDLPIPKYKCNASHDGSSGSMESSLSMLMLELVAGMMDRRVFDGAHITDDDSTLRSHCRLLDNGGN